MKKAAFISILLVIIIIIAACSNEGAAVTEDGASSSQPSVTTDVTFTYSFPEADYEGEEIYFLNTDSKVWDAFSDIVVEEAVGEVLNDAVYTRNQQIEGIFNVTLKQTPIHPSDVIKKALNLILAGDDTHSAMFVSYGWEGSSSSSGGGIGILALEGGLYNLPDLPELQLDKPWWNNKINDQLKIGSSDLVYFASNDIDVYSMQAIITIFFNEKIAENLSLDMPYEIVREGKWTLDVLNSYMKAGANLNGDDNWTWDANGNAIYGYVSYHMGATAALLGTDVKIIDFDRDNTPYFAAENERFYSAIDKISRFFSVEGNFVYADGKPFHRINDVFNNNRTLFVDGSMSNANLLRGMEEPFGILPLPKYDEEQQEYITTIHPIFTFNVIPVTNNQPNKIAAILDAMAYLSYTDVRPAYFDVALSLKQLRNNDSLDMLEIMLDTRSIHIGYAYGWTTTFMNTDMRDIIQQNDPNTASVIEKNKNTIENNIKTTLDYFGNK